MELGVMFLYVVYFLTVYALGQFVCGVGKAMLATRHEKQLAVRNHRRLIQKELIGRSEAKKLDDAAKKFAEARESAKKFAEARAQHETDKKAYRSKGFTLVNPAPPVKKATVTPLKVADFENGLKPQVYGWS